MDNINKLLNDLLEKAKTEKNVLKGLKDTSVKAQMYELAAEIRDIENKNFPETEEQRKAKQLGQTLNTLFRMADLDVPNETCYLLYELVTLHKKKKGSANISDCVNIKFKVRSLFD